MGRSLVRDGAGAEPAAWLRAGSAEQPHRLDNLGAMQPHCTAIDLPNQGRRKVDARFDGGRMSSDGEAIR